jgi:hypothetical protein
MQLDRVFDPFTRCHEKVASEMSRNPATVQAYAPVRRAQGVMSGS